MALRDGPDKPALSINKQAISIRLRKGDYSLQPAKGKSEVWKHFMNILDENKQKIADCVACEKCKSVYIHKSSDGTRSLLHHIKICYTEIKDASDSSHCWTKAGFKRKEEQPSVTESEKHQLNEKVILWSALDYRPLQVAKGEGFEAIAKELVGIGARYGADVDIKSLFLHPSNLSRRHLPQLFDKARSSIAEKLQLQYKDIPCSLPAIGLTTDHWKDSFRKIDYTSLIAHFLDRNFEKNTYTLCVSKYSEETMHYNNIASDIDQKFSGYVEQTIRQNRKQSEVVTCDSDPKMVKGVSQNFDRMSCAGHDLNLAMKYGMDNSGKINAALDHASKSLVDHCKRSSISHKLENQLVHHCETRWNTHYLMYASIIRNWDRIVQCLTERDELHLLANMPRHLLEATANELRPFYMATEKLSVEKSPTLNLVITVYEQIQSRLEKQLKKKLNDSIDPLRKSLLTGLRLKCISKVTWWHVAASLLDPLQKADSSLIPSALLNTVKEDISEILTGIGETVEDCAEEPPSAKRKRTRLNLFSDSEESDEETEREPATDPTPTSKFNEELDRYLEFPVKEDDVDITTWWRSVGLSLFRSLSYVSRSVLALPATSTSSERDFSSAGLTITPRRSSLDSAHVNELLVIRGFFKK